MGQRNLQAKIEQTLDYLNFCQVENELKVLDELNDKFQRVFRVSISNYLNSVTTMNCATTNNIFGGWVEELTEAECFFIIHAKGLNSPLIIHFDRELSYGAIELLAGGVGKEISEFSTKDYTNLETSILKEIAYKIIKDLNDTWRPICDLSLQLDRVEVSTKLVGIVPSDCKIKKSHFQLEFQNYRGSFSVIYPYPAIFPLRNKLHVS